MNTIVYKGQKYVLADSGYTTTYSPSGKEVWAHLKMALEALNKAKSVVQNSNDKSVKSTNRILDEAIDTVTRMSWMLPKE